MKILNASILALSTLLSHGVAHADQGPVKTADYAITITNITHGMLFTPFVAAIHTSQIALFELGSPASDELARVAEGGDTGPLAAKLNDSAEVFAVGSGSGPLFPGQSVTLHINGPKHLSKYRHLSLASMLVPTNDTFVSLNSVKLPLTGSVMYLAKSYDAGSEINDESCVNIPGPFCGGEGYSPDSEGEGFVFPSPATHGEGDLSTATYRWSDPVAKITITKM